MIADCGLRVGRNPQSPFEPDPATDNTNPQAATYNPQFG